MKTSHTLALYYFMLAGVSSHSSLLYVSHFWVFSKPHAGLQRWNKMKKKQNRTNKKEDIIDIKRFLTIATLGNKVCGKTLMLPEIKKETLTDYTGAFEMIGDNFFGEDKQWTAMRSKNIEASEIFIRNLGTEYNGGDTVFVGFSYNRKTTDLNKFNRSTLGKRIDFNQDFVEVLVIAIPKIACCSVKCLNR